MAEIEPTIDKLNESTVMLNMRKLAGAVDKNNQTLQQNVQQAIDTANEAQEAVQGFDERIDANATAIQNEVTARQNADEAEATARANADVTGVDVLYNAGEITVKLSRELGELQDSVDAPFIKTATLIPTSTERAFKIRFTYYDDTTYDTNDFVIPEGGGTDVSVTGVTIEEGATENTFKVSIKLSDTTEIDSNEYPFPTAVTNPYPTAIMLSLGGTNDTTLNVDITLSDNNHETGSVELGEVFATKVDLTGLQGELTSEITDVQKDLQEQITGLKLSKPNQNQIQLNGDNVSVVEQVSGEVVDGKLRLTVNGVTGSDIPLPESIYPTLELNASIDTLGTTRKSISTNITDYIIEATLETIDYTIGYNDIRIPSNMYLFNGATNIKNINELSTIIIGIANVTGTSSLYKLSQDVELDDIMSLTINKGALPDGRYRANINNIHYSDSNNSGVVNLYIKKETPVKAEFTMNDGVGTITNTITISNDNCYVKKVSTHLITNIYIQFDPISIEVVE